MSQPALANKFQQDQDHEKHVRFEKTAEKSTYFVIFGSLILTLLPFEYPVDRKPIYILCFILLGFCLAWFRLLPRKFIGPVKTLLFFLFSLIFIFLGVHLTEGVQSEIIFIFYLVVLRASATLEKKEFYGLVGIITLFLLLETLLRSEIPLNEALSLFALHFWALLGVALFGRYIYDEEKALEASEESLRLRTAKQIDAVKNEFVFVISKKLKEPVALLGNNLAIAVQSVDSGWSTEMKDFLMKAFENTKRLAGLIYDLSDLSGIENQKLRLEIKPLDLNQLIGSILSDFSMRAAEKNTTLTYLPTKETVTVLADSNRLHEILVNLVDNAIKYSPASSQVQISFTYNEKMALVTVKDNGLGIPEEAKLHLFEKFYRVNREASPKGTGLGLFIAKELIEKQGGKIWFESKEKAGTAFHFTLPRG